MLDISGSMNEGEIGRGRDRRRRGTRRFRSPRGAQGLDHALPEDALFDIVMFADGVQVWKPKLVTATKEVKAEAIKWID